MEKQRIKLVYHFYVFIRTRRVRPTAYGLPPVRAESMSGRNGRMLSAGFRRLGRRRTGNGELPKFRTTPKKRAQSQPSGAPWNDGKRSFSTKERLPVWTKKEGKEPIFREKDIFYAISG